MLFIVIKKYLNSLTNLIFAFFHYVQSEEKTAEKLPRFSLAKVNKEVLNYLNGRIAQGSQQLKPL